MSAAERSSWKTLPDPELREQLDFEANFSSTETAQLREGLIPEAMEDKWFVFLEGGWLRFHRSSTGAAIYALLLEDTPNGSCVVESWVNRDPVQYSGTDPAYDRELIRFMIDSLLLGKSVEFPMPRKVEGAVPDTVQHHYIGRGYPERAPGDGSEGNT